MVVVIILISKSTKDTILPVAFQAPEVNHFPLGTEATSWLGRAMECNRSLRISVTLLYSNQSSMVELFQTMKP
jgi:hypothetical protein